MLSFASLWWIEKWYASSWRNLLKQSIGINRRIFLTSPGSSKGIFIEGLDFLDLLFSLALHVVWGIRCVVPFCFWYEEALCYDKQPYHLVSKTFSLPSRTHVYKIRFESTSVHNFSTFFSPNEKLFMGTSFFNLKITRLFVRGQPFGTESILTRLILLHFVILVLEPVCCLLLE